MYAWWAGLRRQIVYVAAGLLWGWLLFAGASFLWHQDMDRVIDLIRSFMLGMFPLVIAAPTLILITRPVDIVKVLRMFRLPPAVLIPVASVSRQALVARSRFHGDPARLRDECLWNGPWSLIRTPRTIGRRLLWPQMHGMMNTLIEEPPPCSVKSSE